MSFMQLLPLKIIRSLRDLISAAWLMRNPIAAICFFRSKKNVNGYAKFRVGRFDLHARKQDWPGIREIFIEDEYEVLDAIRLGAEAPRILDIGANIGGFALRAFQHWPMAEVVSVEAAPDTYEILQANRCANACLAWQALNAGVWGSDGTLVLDRKPLSISHRVSQGGNGEFIPSITLATLLDRIGWQAVDLMKIDIEGAEEIVIPAASDVFRKTGILIVEIHNDRINPQPVYRTLASVFRYCWQLNQRFSNKPVLILANRDLHLKSIYPIELRELAAL